MTVHQVGDLRLGNPEQRGHLALFELLVFAVSKHIAGAFFTFNVSLVFLVRALPDYRRAG